MCRSCKRLEDFVNHNFVVSVILGSLRKLGVRLVLNLTSSMDLGFWEEGQYMVMVSKINIKEIKRLTFNGPSFRGSNGYFALSKLYNCYNARHGENLETLDILVDSFM